MQKNLLNRKRSYFGKMVLPTQSLAKSWASTPNDQQLGENNKIKSSKGLKIGKRGCPFGAYRTLAPEQELFIQRAVRNRMPDQIKLPFTLWTRRAIKPLIKNQYQVSISIRSIGEYL